MRAKWATVAPSLRRSTMTQDRLPSQDGSPVAGARGPGAHGRTLSPSYGGVAFPEGVEQPAALDGDLEVALRHQRRENPVGLLHRERGL